MSIILHITQYQLVFSDYSSEYSLSHICDSLCAQKAMNNNYSRNGAFAPRKVAYSVDQIAEATSLSKAFLRKEIRLGRLKVRRFGRRVVILDTDLADYLERRGDGYNSQPSARR